MVVEVSGSVVEVIRDSTAPGVSVNTLLIEVIRGLSGDDLSVSGLVVEILRDPSEALEEGSPSPAPPPPDPGTEPPPYPDQGTPDEGTPQYPSPEGLPDDPDDGVSARSQGSWVPGAVVAWVPGEGWVPARIAKREDGQWTNEL